MRSRSFLSRTALIVLSALAFAQAAFAAALCDGQMRSPAQAIAEESAPCHEGAAESRTANLCLAHCQSELQNLDKPSVSVPAMPSTPVLLVSLATAPAEASRVAALLSQTFPPGAPPPLIPYQVILQ